MSLELQRSFSAPLTEIGGEDDSALSQPSLELADVPAAAGTELDDAQRNAQPVIPARSPFRRPSLLLGHLQSTMRNSEPSSPDPSSSLGTPSPVRFRSKDMHPMLSTMTLRLQGPFQGSTTLPAVEAAEPRAPSTVFSKKNRNNTFESAKVQVDKELRSFKKEATTTLLNDRASGVIPDDDVLPSLLEIVERCLDDDVSSFKHGIQGIVDNLEGMRRRCDVASRKALVTSLLFILTRCSRLLPTEDSTPQFPNQTANMYGTLPRGNMSERWRKVSGLPPTTARRPAGGLPRIMSSPKTTVPRSLTMPSRTLRDMVAGFQHLRVNNGREKPQTLFPLTESPLTPTRSAASSAELDVTPMGSPAGHLGSSLLFQTSRRSPLGRNVVTALEAELDQVALTQPRHARLSAAPADPEDFVTPPGTPQSVAKHSFHPAKSTQKRERGLGLVASFKRLQKRLSRGREDQELIFGEDTSSASEAKSNLDSPSTPAAARRMETLGLEWGTSSRGGHADWQAAASTSASPTHAPKAGRHTLDLGTVRVSEAEAECPSDESAATPKGARLEAASLAVRAAADGGASSPESWSRSPRCMKPAMSLLSPRRMEHVICRICEEQVIVDRMEEHSRLCSCVDEAVAEDFGLDAYLTRLADFMEKHVQALLDHSVAEGLRVDDIEDMGTLVTYVRSAAALQPDSTADPAERCRDMLSQVDALLEGAGMTYARLSVDVELFASRARRSIAAKVEELYSYLPVRRSEDAGSGIESTPPNAASTAASFGSMNIDDFTLLKPISRGSFGRVYLCQKNATKDLYAIKIMRKAELRRKNMVDNVKNERNILAITNNPFVVSFFYSFTNEYNLYIVMEYCNGGDCCSLLKSLGCMDEDVARLYIAETILALEYCHTKGIIHRDLKPENLLISADGHIKLTDFGLSTIGIRDTSNKLMVDGAAPMDTDSNQSTPRSMSLSTASSPRRWSAQSQLDARPHSADSRQTSRRTQRSASLLQRPSETGVGQGYDRLVVSEEEAHRAVGTPDYLAPELLLGSRHGHEVDWWSLGVILYEFVMGVPPFSAETPKAIFDNILDRRINWPSDPDFDLSEECRDLIEQLLNPEPEQRLGHRGAGEVKLHAFFQAKQEEGKKGINWKELVTQKAAFVPSSESKLAPSVYFEEKPFSKRSMELDTRSEREDASRRGKPSPGGSLRSRGSKSRSRRAMRFPTDDHFDRLSLVMSPASSISTTSAPSQALPSPGMLSRPMSAEPSAGFSSTELSFPVSTDIGSTAAASMLDAAVSPIRSSETGSSSSVSRGSRHVDGGDGGGSDALDESVFEPDNQFMNWSYKNVELLNERNREMAEQFAELRSESGDKPLKDP